MSPEPLSPIPGRAWVSPKEASWVGLLPVPSARASATAWESPAPVAPPGPTADKV